MVSIDIICLLAMPLWAKVIGIVVTAIYGASILWQYVLLRNRNSIIKMKRQEDGQWLIHTNSGKYETQLCGDSTVTAMVSILRFRSPKSFWRKTAIVFRDSLTKEQYRELLVTLRMQ